jgi:hypothetical protein
MKDRFGNGALYAGLTLSFALMVACGGGGGGGGGGPTPNPVPTTSSTSPTATTVGGSSFTLTVNGSRFISGSSVRWNASPRTTTFVSSTQLTAAITAEDIATAGAASVTVSNPAPGGGTSGSLTFTVNPPIMITTSSLPPTANGKDYYFSLGTSGGTAPFTWTVASGSLPTGLSLDSAAGAISGTVTSVAGSSFTVQAVDSATTPDKDVKNLTITLTGLGRNDQVCISPGVPGPDAATPISNGTLRASISPYGDIDTYTLTLTQTTTNLNIETFAEKLNIGNNLVVRSDFLDTVLELLDSSCNLVTLNDDQVLGVNTDSLIQIGPTPFPTSPPSNSADFAAPTSLPPGTYYIRIRDYRATAAPT